MSISKFFTKTATMKRLADIENTDKEQYEPESATFKCHIQDMDGDFGFILEGGVKKAYQMWCPISADIKQGDRIIIKSKEYQIYSAKAYNINKSSNKHKKCIIYFPL